jgi:hypothetical protein
MNAGIEIEYFHSKHWNTDVVIKVIENIVL